jgi:hypothetical protein
MKTGEGDPGEMTAVQIALVSAAHLRSFVLGSKTIELKQRSLATLIDTGEIKTFNSAEVLAAMHRRDLYEQSSSRIF